MISSGQLRPGTRLPAERDLMQKFHVGRSAIREALAAQHRMGVITLTHGARAQVRVPSAHEVIEQIGRTARLVLRSDDQLPRELREARSLFEIAMVRAAAESADAADLERLATALAVNRDAIKDRDLFVRTDIRFHVAIAEISRNSVFVTVSEAMLRWLSEYHSEIVRFPGAEAVAYREHERIFGTIAAKDLAGAERAMRDHLNRIDAFFTKAPAAKGRVSGRLAKPGKR
jgi:GntR family transcriptional regulator, sialic acid-inducible nan operon repressor